MVFFSGPRALLTMALSSVGWVMDDPMDKLINKEHDLSVPEYQERQLKKTDGSRDLIWSTLCCKTLT